MRPPSAPCLGLLVAVIAGCVPPDAAADAACPQSPPREGSACRAGSPPLCHWPRCVDCGAAYTTEGIYCWCPADGGTWSCSGPDCVSPHTGLFVDSECQIPWRPGIFEDGHDGE